MKEILTYWIWVVFAMYASYLTTFKTYVRKDYRHGDMKRVTFPNIVYILGFLLCFAPIINIVMSIIFIMHALVNQNWLFIDSWLFRKPVNKGDSEDSEDF